MAINCLGWKVKVKGQNAISATSGEDNSSCERRLSNLGGKELKASVDVLHLLYSQHAAVRSAQLLT